MKFILYFSEYPFHICMNVCLREGTENCCLSFRYFIAQEQTGTIWKLHSCGKCPNSQILQNSFFGEKTVLATLDVEENTSPTMTTIFQGKHSIAIDYKKRSKLNTAFLQKDNLMFKVYLELQSNYKKNGTTRKLWNDFGVLDSIHCS